jgi:hypothetical protein
MSLDFTGVQNFSWLTTLSTSEYLPLREGFYDNLDDINVIKFIRNDTGDRLYIATSKGNDICIFESPFDLSSMTLVLSTNEIFTNSNTFFSNITAFNVIGDNFYVLDAGTSQLHSYSIRGFTTEDNTLKHKLLYINTIGDTGNFSDKTSFNSPRSFCTQDRSLLVLDSSNNCIKRFDENLNWQYTYLLTKDFLSAYPIFINTTNSGVVCVITSNQKLFMYEDNFNNKVVIDIKELTYDMPPNEYFKQITFSPSDSSICYLITDDNIYKKFTNYPFYTIGKYLFYLFQYNTTEKIRCFDSTAIAGQDYNIMFSKDQNDAGKFSLFYDNINLFDVLAVPDFDVYTSDDIHIGKDEYVQNWVINKALAKLLINHMRFRDQITGKFLQLKDNKGNYLFKGTRYFNEKELQQLVYQQDIENFIGENELVTNFVMNRVLKRIYDIQQLLLNALTVENYLNTTQGFVKKSVSQGTPATIPS